MKILNVAAYANSYKQNLGKINFKGDIIPITSGNSALSLESPKADIKELTEVKSAARNVAGLQYAKEASEILDFAYSEYDDAKKLLDKNLKVMKRLKITGNFPVDKEFKYQDGGIAGKLYSNCTGGVPLSRYELSYIYDSTLELYGKDGSLKRKVVFSKIPPNDKTVEYTAHKYTETPFVKSIKEYDENGNLTKVIKGDTDNQVASIKFYNKKGKNAEVNFSDGKIVNYQNGDFITSGSLLKCPTTFLFKNDKLSEVRKNLTYNGFHIINCDTYNFEDGKYLGYKNTVSD